jgi:hypothetical protein
MTGALAAITVRPKSVRTQQVCKYLGQALA